MSNNYQWAMHCNSKLQLEILQRLMEGGGELPPELEAIQRAADKEREEIIEAAICTYHDLKALEELHVNEMRRLQERKEAIESKRATIAKWLETVIDADAGWQKGTRSARWHKNPPSVEIKDETAIPIEFIKYKPSPNRELISETLKSGGDVPGCRLITDKKHLRIK